MTANFLAGRSGRANFSDVQGMMKAVLRDWPQECIQLTPGPGDGEHQYIETDALRLDASRWSTGTLIRGEGAAQSVCIGLVDGDPSDIRFCGRPLAPLGVPMVQSGVEFEFSSPAATAALVLTIDQTAFNRHLHALWGMELTPSAAYALPLAGVAEGMAAVEKLKSMLRHLPGQSALRTSPRLAALATEDILSGLLTAAQTPPLRILPPYRHNLAREAAAMLRSSADPISIKGLCERLRISWRALDQGFQELYGVSPKTYMRISRLHHVRRELTAADPSGASVTDIAVGWGFFQLGRFSVDYKRLFGEKPSETLWRVGG